MSDYNHLFNGLTVLHYHVIMAEIHRVDKDICSQASFSRT